MGYASLAQISSDEVAERPISEEHGSFNNEGIKHAKRNIILATLSVSLPMLILGGILVGLVQRYSLDQSDPWFTSVEYQGAKSDSSAFYLDMSATRFVTVASWISTIAVSLSGFIMLIFSYQVARNLLEASDGHTSNRNRPTPFQLNLYLQARAGNVASIWEMIKYATWKKRADVGFMLTHTTLVLLLTFALSYAIWGLDTWLHLSTTATSLTRSLTDPAIHNNYTRHISCNTTGNTYNSCSTNTHGIGLVTQAFQILNNMSDTHMVSTYQDKSQTFAYVTSAQIQRGHSFEASTLAINTQCEPVLASSCDLSIGLDSSKVYVGWETSCEHFTSNVWAPVALAGMNTSLIWLDQADVKNASSIDHATTNPFSFAVEAVSGSFNTNLASDNRSLTVGADHKWFVGFVLNCTSTVYNIQYRWINGSFFDVRSSNLSDEIMGNTFSAPFKTGIGLSTLANAAATSVGMSTMDSLADTFSIVFSKTAMSLGASVAQPGSNLSEGELVIGARVPKRPLITLLVIVLLYAVWGLALGLAALISRSRDVDDVQARLTIAGLAAKCFEETSTQQSVRSTEDLFAEPVSGDNSVRLHMKYPADSGNLEWRATKYIDSDGPN